MPVTKPDVAVIIINYNSSHFTIGCVQSIIDQTVAAIHYEIVIVDNNSVVADREKLVVLESLKGVKIVKSKINLGFSGGNMLGVQHASADYYYFLNNDCVLLNDCLHVLFTFCEKNLQAGLCSGQMFNKSLQPEDTFDYFPTLASKLLGISLLRAFNPDKYPRKKQQYDSPVAVDLISGSSLFVRSDAFCRIGGFDTTYFLYCEEEDLAMNIHHNNYGVYLVPAARYQHFGGGSTHFNLSIEKEFYISFLYFYLKHYGWWKREILKVLLFFKLIRKTFRNRNYFLLAMFVLSGAHLKHSLRHRQQISQSA